VKALKATVMAWLERVLTRRSATYRWMQWEESESIKRQQRPNPVELAYLRRGEGHDD